MGPDGRSMLGGGFVLQVEPGDAPRSFRLSGELDLATADELLAAIGPAAEGGGDLRLDLSGVSFIDSSGLRGLVQLSHALLPPARLVLEKPSDQVNRLFELVQAERFPNVVVEPAGD
jgi:anti-anti-sigma factor